MGILCMPVLRDKHQRTYYIQRITQNTGGERLMARIAGVDLPREKRIEIALTYVYGIGLSTSQKILKETGVDPDIRVKDL